MIETVRVKITKYLQKWDIKVLKKLFGMIIVNKQKDTLSMKKDLLAELCNEFCKKKNSRIAKEQQRYMKSKMPYYGIQAQQYKKIYPPIFN